MSATLAEKLRGKRGIRFFGDVHGHFDAFKAMAEDAIVNGWHLHSLGDLIDKGPMSPACMRLACDLSDADWLDLSPGNHCEKFMRWMQGKPVKLKRHGLASTVSQLGASLESKETAERYFTLVAESKLWSRYGNIYAVHAAFDRRMIGIDGPQLQAKPGCPSSLRSRALYGETDGTVDADEFPHRTFGWLDDIPADAVVLVGHTVFSLESITERRNAAGGRLIHLDTGLEAGGKLSFLDIPTAVLAGEAPFALGDLPEPGARIHREAA